MANVFGKTIETVFRYSPPRTRWLRQAGQTQNSTPAGFAKCTPCNDAVNHGARLPFVVITILPQESHRAACTVQVRRLWNTPVSFRKRWESSSPRYQIPKSIFTSNLFQGCAGTHCKTRHCRSKGNRGHHPTILGSTPLFANCELGA